MVGGGGNNPDFISVVVDRLPQRLVLNADRFSVWRGRPRPRRELWGWASNYSALPSTAAARPPDEFSNGGAPTTTGRDSGARSLQ